MKTLNSLIAALRPDHSTRAAYARQTVKAARRARARAVDAAKRTERPRAAERAWRDQFTA